MRKLLVAVLLSLACAPLGAHAVPPDDGCYVIGEVQGLDTERTCTYVAQSTDQNVYVGTPFHWRVWVLRYDDHNQPLDITLADGNGPQPGIPVAHPNVGEKVYVTMYFGCQVPYCGTIGFLGAGLEQGL